MTDDKTKVSEKRIQIRMVSGKIYGPYTRREVLSFIHSRKLKGQEEILFEGESNWKGISSDIDFFDAFQDVLVGRSPRLDRKNRLSKAEETKLALAEHKEGVDLPKTAVSQPFDQNNPPQLTQTQILKDKGQEAPIGVQDFIGRDSFDLEPLPQPLAPPEASLPQIRRPLAALGKNSRPRIILGAVVLGLLALVFLPLSSTKITNLKDLNFHNSLIYSKSLQEMMRGVPLKMPAVPLKVERSSDLQLPQGFGANIWAQDLLILSELKDPNARNSAGYWARWAWSLMWIGEVIHLFEPKIGKQLKDNGEALLGELKSRKALTEEQLELFACLDSLFLGDWIKAQSRLQKIKNNELAQWLAELSSWMAFWERGAKGEIYQSSYSQYSSLNLEVPSKIRRALAAQDTNIFPYVQTLAVEDPLDFSLWFNLGEYVWRLGKTNIQSANRFFIIGLPTVAFVPAAFQRVYWMQFHDFLLSFGRKSSADRALANAEILSDKDLSENSSNQKNWWDLGQEGLGFDAIAQDILARARRDDLNAVDMASLRAMAFVAPNGAELLTEAGNYLNFDGYFTKSRTLLELATRIDKNRIDAWGALLWAESGLHQFDRALKILDTIGGIKNDVPEPLKYKALLQAYGREYEEAEKNFRAYSKAAPGDPWSHYFRAAMQLRLENSLECSKSANLARIHGKGLIQKRATLLLYKCKVLSKLEVKGVLEELKKLSAAEPQSIPIALELIEAYLNADLLDRAQELAEASVLKFPRSYELRVKLGEVHERRGNFDMAVAFYNDSKKDRADSADASIRIAKILEREGRLVEAAQNYETAARVDPAYPEIYLLAARAFDKLGKAQEASQMYMREIEERPSTLSSFLEAADFMISHNSAEDVPKIFQKFSADYQSDSRVLTRLAQSYLAVKNTDQARQTAALALSQDPGNPEANRVLAVIYESAGQYEMAKRHYESYLKNMPQAPDGDEIRNKLSRPPFSIR